MSAFPLSPDVLLRCHDWSKRAMTGFMHRSKHDGYGLRILPKRGACAGAKPPWTCATSSQSSPSPSAWANLAPPFWACRTGGRGNCCLGGQERFAPPRRLQRFPLDL